MKLTTLNTEQFVRVGIKHLNCIIQSNKNAGYIVETKNGLVGRTFHCEELINGKQIVHTEKGKLLCILGTLKLKGFID